MAYRAGHAPSRAERLARRVRETERLVVALGADVDEFYPRRRGLDDNV
jgi:hypothetical protein